ncbi:VRR-NUC domain-containing protein [Mycena alexandri]|uniref:Fanconi-associated nuclease n=1 Tax=Mycena alexandri TaxID=1745969 RepID=A0AAD6S3P5_9AGAR|nr:VRR-NUC domain-containing protein [Mycena alexandri]
MSRWTIRDLLLGIDEEIYDKEFEEPPRATVPQASTANGPEQAVVWEEPSVYVKVPERAIEKIMELEHYLFTEEERAFIESISEFEYHSRFILFRLTPRKTGKWHRLTAVERQKGYVSEVGEHGLLDAFEKLSRSSKPMKEPQPMEIDKNGNEIIDLTADSDDEDGDNSSQPVAGPSRGPNLPTDDGEARLDYFCKSAEDISTLDGLQILKAGEVKDLCKTLKIDGYTKKNKDQMIAALMDHAKGQTVITFGPSSKSKGKGKDKNQLRQTTLPFARAKVAKSQESRLRTLMLKALGKVVLVNPHLYTLMLRLSIIWHRSTEYPEQLFHPALMAGFNKQVYARYDHVRTDIWHTRDQYLEYENAIKVEALIDEISKAEPKNAKKPTSLVPGRFLTHATPGLEFIRRLTPPARAPSLQTEGAAPDDEEALEFDVVEDTVNQQKARVIKQILEEHALAKWKELVEAESQRETPRRPGLERFEAGYVYTRIIRKCSGALATLKEFACEKVLLDMLLGQRFWRLGSRGGWYERRALIQMTHLFKNSDGIKDMNVIRDARAGLQEALADDDTATIARPALIRRLERVEKTLRLKPELRTKFDDLALKKPDEDEFIAVRVWEHPDAFKLDGSGRVKGKENKTAGPSIAKYLVGSKTEKPDAVEPKKGTWTGKSLWQGNEGTVNVEGKALEYYAQSGFKGFHSETQILTTLFGLLFWDIIFAQVPGAFETPWQRGPLDLMDDSFYYARQDRIETRLAEIRAGQARSILEGNDDRYRQDNTCCIGVSWEMCGRDDLVEIVECLGGDALASICRLFCEDYGGRNSGVPDLVIWHPDTKECKFVEVKGPGDNLQENQRLWSDALLTAGCPVEICYVLDSKKPKSRVKKAPRASTSKAKKGKAKAFSAQPESDVEEETQPMVIDDEEAWVPSTTIKPLPPRERKRRRDVDEDDDEEQDDHLPVFSSPPEREPPSSHHPPPAIARKRRAASPSTSSSKKRKTN